MIKHYFKIVWARRKQNLLMGGTLFLAFLVLAFFSSYMFAYIIPIWSDQGFDDERVYLTIVKYPADQTEAANAVFPQMRRQLEMLPGVESLTWTDQSAPYSSTGKSIQILNGDEMERVFAYWVDEQFSEVLKLSILKGRWFNQEDVTNRVPPVVITREMKDTFFPQSDAIGETLVVDEKPYRVVGVSGDYRNLPDGDCEPTVFFRYEPQLVATGNPRVFLIKYQNGVNMDTLGNSIESVIEGIPLENGWIMGRMSNLNDLYQDKIKIYSVSITMGVFIGFILILNVAVGILGVFWNNVLSRFPEIGIRRALGSRKKGIYLQIIGESFALVTMAIIPSLLLFIQVPIFNAARLEWEDCIVGMTFAAVFLYSMVALCSLYPGWLAASLQPTAALHED